MLTTEYLRVYYILQMLKWTLSKTTIILDVCAKDQFWNNENTKNICENCPAEGQYRHLNDNSQFEGCRSCEAGQEPKDDSTGCKSCTAGVSFTTIIKLS